MDLNINKTLVLVLNCVKYTACVTEGGIVMSELQVHIGGENFAKYAEFRV